jgi:hypothetical protein
MPLVGEDIDEGGDPPRVWSAHGNYPGTAFTRSIGDRVAEDCGVYAEPEILERCVNHAQLMPAFRKQNVNSYAIIFFVRPFIMQGPGAWRQVRHNSQ